MSLIFRYAQAKFQKPALSIGGRFVRPRPLIDLDIIGPKNTRDVVGLLDTGSDDTIFPEYIARRIGIDLAHAPSGLVSGLGKSQVAVRYAQVQMRIVVATETREWPAIIGFAPHAMPYALLGFAGFLQFFTATFHGDLEQVELAVNRLYPGI